MADQADWLKRFLVAERLPDGFAQIVAGRYLPMAQRIAAAREGRRAPLVVGICGPQGSGKTTGAAVLTRLLGDMGLRVARLSIDDLYLTRAERLDLADRVHPLLATRGVPGTHDVGLGIRTLEAVGGEDERTVRLPAFDKATDDRLPPSVWPSVDAPADIALFEGWCVGARPQAEAALATPLNRLEAEEDVDGRWRLYVNDALAGAYQHLFGRIDLLIQFVAPGFDTVRRWRGEQEAKLRARAGHHASTTDRVMDDTALDRFLDHYERLTTHIAQEMPARADIVLHLDEARDIIP